MIGIEKEKNKKNVADKSLSNKWTRASKIKKEKY